MQQAYLQNAKEFTGFRTWQIKLYRRWFGEAAKKNQAWGEHADTRRLEQWYLLLLLHWVFFL